MKKRKEKQRMEKLIEGLTYKADIYGPNGRIYSFKAPWRFDEHGNLFHGEVQYQLKDLYDGHCRPITFNIDTY